MGSICILFKSSILYFKQIKNSEKKVQKRLSFFMLLWYIKIVKNEKQSLEDRMEEK